MLQLGMNVQKVLEWLMQKGLSKSTGCCVGFLLPLAEMAIVWGE